MVSIKIKNSMTKCLKFTKSVSEGDLTVKLNLNTKDEFGILAQSLNKTVEKLKSMTTDVITNSNQTTKLSKKLNTSVEKNNNKMQNISTSTSTIATGMENTNSSIEEVSASSQEINASVTQLAQQSQDCNNSAMDIKKRAVKIEKRVDDSKKATRNICMKKEENIVKVIEEGKVVEEIEQMAEIISNIASQTNLLALNAAIEAAGAGEHGKGFAVVAEEIRKLAEQSSSTVKDIQPVIQRVKKAFNNFTKESQDIINFINKNINDDYVYFEKISIRYKKDSEFLYKISQELSSSLIDSIIKNISCYSGKILEAFTHAETPWLVTRGDLPASASTNRKIEKN